MGTLCDSCSVAVIIPAYNGELYLRESIESVLSQTLPPAEIVVIDDGSTDASLRIAQAYEPRIRVISRPNGGVSAARNFGASITTAPWLAFLDHDDCWEPDFLAHATEVLLDTPDAAFLYTDRRVLYHHAAGITLSEPQSMPSPRQLPRHLLDRCPFTPCSALVHRQAFLAVGGFDSRHNGVEDWDLWLRLSAHGIRFAHCPQPLVRYRVHQANASRNALKMLTTSFSVLDQNLRPQMTLTHRITTLNRVKSRLQGEAAILMRENRTSGCFAMMMRSILRHPFHEARRYPIALHMLLSILLIRSAALRHPLRHSHHASRI
ncbi:MAG: glycosyltransferase [Edaphobacter sp.]|uniref:glycosyltransferase n=1 Tax=Edaphobacter sp. TaxID=1934404 RepID=UPI00239EB0FE|nr:glycosyltransferase [Edaphobacter sp.]MDE1178491.1 glycosyltransferase [Edaphobacter sp.]